MHIFFTSWLMKVKHAVKTQIQSNQGVNKNTLNNKVPKARNLNNLGICLWEE